mmetsp:Transcript_37807/g.84557  ORF Transcript_37807/g.84557 Transcript_37807/m.84557 type:complete len:230 (+) Transcript_37807:691-1380(+)
MRLVPVKEGGAGIVEWLGAFVDRLERGVFRAMPLVPTEPDSKGINLFPRYLPNVIDPSVSRVVTRGVEVIASTVHMIQNTQHGWTYSIRLRLLPPGHPEHSPAAERGFETCQLTTRVWKICPNEAAAEAVQRVEGEGVIGFFPILCEEGWRCDRSSDPHAQYPRGGPRDSRLIPGDFEYQSCSGGAAPGARGWFEGVLRFVQGSKESPTGEEFEVAVGRFALCPPEFYF